MESGAILRGARPADRLAAGFLLVLLAVGSLALWIGVPALCLWAASKAADTLAYHFILALLMTLVAMSVWFVFLTWLNQLYMRVSGMAARIEADRKAGWARERFRGPLELFLTASFMIALAALFVWFFFFAENPSSQVI
jgi:hypothetical protein